MTHITGSGAPRGAQGSTAARFDTALDGNRRGRGNAYRPQNDQGDAPRRAGGGGLAQLIQSLLAKLRQILQKLFGGQPPAPPTPPGDPVPAGALTLSSNAIGAQRLTFNGDGTARLTGPGIDITFTGVAQTGAGQANPLTTAREGSGTINGQPVKAVPDASGAALRLQSGFAGQSLSVDFDNGTALSALATPLTDPGGPVNGTTVELTANDAGASQLVIGTDSLRLIGPETDFTFTGLRDQRPVDGPLTATAGQGVINGVQTTAVPINPFGNAVFSLGSGFNPTGTQAVNAAFANGVTLDATVQR